MDRKDVAYLINTTPKYFYLLRLHLTLLARYAPTMRWPVYLATEAEGVSAIKDLMVEFPELRIIGLAPDQEPFLESRLAATNALPPEIRYVFPIQEDFLLEGRPIESVLKESVEILDRFEGVDSLRIMPCPGPKGTATFYCGQGSQGSHEPGWRVLGADDAMIFVYQATLWRREAYAAFMGAVIAEVDREFGPLTPKQKVDVQIRMNVAEVELGQNILRQGTGMHLAWERLGTQPNAVYLCPWPYRPTAVVNGKLQGWAAQLAEREGVALWTSV